MELPRVRRIATPFLPVYLALGLAFGIAAGEVLANHGYFTCTAGAVHPAPALFLLPTPLFVVLAVRGWRRRRIAVPALMAFMACIGAWRYSVHPFAPCLGPADLAFYNRANPYGANAVLEGVITAYPEQRQTYAQYRVRIDTLWEGGGKRSVRGDALVRTGLEPPYHYGDRLRIRGVPSTPPTFSDFDYRRYLARKGIFTLITRADAALLDSDQGNPFWSALYAFRARASATLDATIIAPCTFIDQHIPLLRLQCRDYAALANGMILGIETGIPRDLYDQFNLTGTSHVIVISGSNIAIVSGLFLLFFSKLFRRRKGVATAFTLAGIALYTLLVGADAAVTRAAIMGALFVLSVYLGRSSTALVSLFFAGLVMLIINPLTLWDVGFQLSFMATLGLILFSRPLQRRWQALLGRRLPRFANNILAEGLLITLAAQITTMPLVVYHFGRLSLISFLANLLILPVQPPIMIAGGLAIFTGLLASPLGQLLALIPTFSLWWTVLIVQKMAAIPWGSLEISAFGRLLAALYTLIFGLGFLWWLLRQEQRAPTFLPAPWRAPLLTSLSLAFAIILPLWTGATILESRPDGLFHLHVLGQEQAVAFLLISPGGNRILLDPRRSAPAYPLASILTSLPGAHRPLDLVIATRAAPPSADALQPAHTSSLNATDPALQPGATIRLDNDLSLTLLYKPTTEDDSLLFHLRYHDFTMLLPFENSQETQMALRDHLPTHPTLLLAPFPGTGAWPSPALLETIRPQIILTPAGATYPPSVQQALSTHNLVPIPNNADVEIITDGHTLRFAIRPYPQDIGRD